MNKHKLTAILFIPILGLGGFFLAGYLQQPEQATGIKTMTSSGPCVLSQQCILKADNLQVQLSYSGKMKTSEVINIHLTTSSPVDNVLLALSDPKKNSQPAQLSRADNHTQWQGQYRIEPSLDLDNLIIQMVVISKDIQYLAEVRPRL
ncbi:MAG: hypothetical protein OQK73_11490 [Gammaproteobacteria bacterium]|nr:hypothetical protein [Gammaproteobacteria bacterium]